MSYFICFRRVLDLVLPPRRRKDASCSRALSRSRQGRLVLEPLETRRMLATLVSTTESLSFSTRDQSMWGPDGPAVLDSGELIWTPLQWNTGVLSTGSLNLPNGNVDATASTNGAINFDFQARLDPGSVDADYHVDVALDVVEKTDSTYTIVTRTVGAPDGRLATRSPNIEVDSHLNFQFGANLDVSGQVTVIPEIRAPRVWVPKVWIPRVCIPFTSVCTGGFYTGGHYTGGQVLVPEQSFSFAQSLLNLNIDQTQELLHVDNTQIRVLGEELAGADPGGQLALEIDLPVEFDITDGTPNVEPTVTDASRPKKSRKPHLTDPFEAGLSFSAGDMTVYVPNLQLEQAAFSTDNGVLGLRANGDTNLARFDLDLDFLLSALTVMPPLGVGAGLTFAGIDIVSAQLDLLDADAGPLLKVDQDFEFIPDDVDVVYTFDDVVTIDGQQVSTYTAPVGRDVDFMYQGTQDLGVSTDYVLRNSFRNTTQLELAAQYDLRVLGLAVSTFLGDLPDLVLFDPPPQQIGSDVPLGDPLFNKTYGLDFAALPGSKLVLDLVNDPPVASNDSAATAASQPVTVDVLGNDRDADGDTLTISGVQPPANGTATVNPDRTITYRPNENFDGIDLFTYTANDGNLGADTATVTVTVNALNQPPVALDDTFVTDEDASHLIDVLANDRDANGDPLTVVIDTPPLNGSVNVGAHGAVTYTPALNFHGTDLFTYGVDDGNGATDTAMVTITVNSVNDAPVAVDDMADTSEDTATTIEVLRNDVDVDGDLLTVRLATDPAHGLAVVRADGTIHYTPNPDYFGSDSLVYQLTDGNSPPATANVTIFISPVNDAPVAGDVLLAADEDALAVNGTFRVDDVDSRGPFIFTLSQPEQGAVENLGNGRFVFLPGSDFQDLGAGQTRRVGFNFTATDSLGVASLPATANIVVSGRNDAPQALGGDFSTTESTPVDIDLRLLVSDRETPADALDFALSNPIGGRVELVDGYTARFIPADGHQGLATFEYTASDQGGGGSPPLRSDIAIVRVDVVPLSEALVDVTGLVDVSYAQMVYSRRTQSTTFQVEVTNRSSQPLAMPMQLKWTDVSGGANIQVRGFDAQDANGAYVVNLADATGDGYLQPGESITLSTLSIYNPDRLRITFNSVVMAADLPLA